jgi:intein/homing endonuclease
MYQERRPTDEEIAAWRKTGAFGNVAVVCVKAGELVYCVEGPKPIEDVKIGDSVLTHNGEFRRVVATFKRHYAGPLIKLQVNSSVSVQVTPEHPILVRRGKRSCWVNASNVKLGDRVFTPKIREKNRWMCKEGVHLSHFISVGRGRTKLSPLNEVYYVKGGGLRFPEKVLLTPAFAELVGLHISEGSTSRGGRIYIPNRSHEVVERAINDFVSLGLSPVYTRGKNPSVQACSRTLARFLRNTCGSNARNKRMPKFFMSLPLPILASMLRGLWLGDGCLYRRKGYARYSTTSAFLAHQVRMALLRFHIYPFISYSKGVYEVYCHLDPFIRRVLKNEDWLIEEDWLGGSVKRMKNSRVTETKSGFWYPITSVERVDYTGFVYNLAVKQSNSFLINGIASHNCGSVSGNLVVLDFDDWSVYGKVFPKHGELEKVTFVVKTARGVHVYLRSGRDPGRTEKFETLKFEYRADGSYVVAPFSVHPSGAIYKRIGVLELLQVDDAREELKNILKRLGYVREFRDVMEDVAKNVALTGEPYRGLDPPCVQELLKGVDMGMRNNTCIKLASYFLAFRKKSVEKTLETLLDWNKRNRPPLEELEVKRVIKNEVRRGYRFGCNSFSQTCRPAACPLVFEGEKTIRVEVGNSRLVMATRQYTFPAVNNRVLLLPQGRRSQTVRITNPKINKGEVLESDTPRLKSGACR